MSDIQKQIDRRRQRALEEITKVANKGRHPLFSTFEVSSTSGQTYRVDVRSLDELQNSCTCADYKSNLIGTCKHIEGVLLYLRKEHGEQKLAALAAKRPPASTVYLRYGEDISVRVGLPLPRVPAVREVLARHFDPTGVLTGAPLLSLPALLAALEALPARHRQYVRVDEAVREHLELLQDREAVQRQKEWFLEQVQSGHRSFGVLATKLYPYQQEGAMHLVFGRRAMLADDMGLGKCVGPETPVFVNGTLLRAATLWYKFAGAMACDAEGEWAEPTAPLWVNALDAQGRIIQTPITRLYRQRVKEPMRRVRLDDGSELLLTRRHKLLLRDGWSERFRPGDVVCVPGHLEWNGPEADPDLVMLLAWQIAEGYELTGRATVNITQKDTRRLEQLRESARRIGEKFGLQMNSLAVYQPPGKAAYLTLSSRDYQRFLAEQGYGWGEKSAGKSIPDFIMQAGPKTIRLFLREFFSAEASAVASMRSVEISSASGWLMQQISVLLRRCGIWLRCAQKQKRATNGSGIWRTYHSGTLGGNAARHFLREVGFSDEDKQRRLEAICDQPANTNVEGIPASDMLIEMAERTGLPKRHFGVSPVSPSAAGSQELARASVTAVVGALDRILSGEAEAGYRRLPGSKWTSRTLANYAALDHAYLEQQRARLSEVIGRQVFYAHVAEIGEVEYEGWVYDFEIAEHHNFVAAGMLCHNTVQAIAAAALLKELRDIQRVLVITPASLKHQWAREIRRFSSLPVTVVEGGLAARRKLYRENSFFTLLNYELVRRDEDELERLRPHLIILDEAQRIKNWRTKTAAAVKRLQSRYAFVLTGTPLENRLDELYSIFQFLDPRILGPLWHFNDRFYELEQRDENSYKVLGYKNFGELRATIAPYSLRRTRSEVLKDLPPRIDNHFFVEMTDPQWKAYNEFRETLARLLSISKRRPLTPKEHDLLLMALVKMRLICNALALHDKEIPAKDREKTAPKLRELGQILTEEIASNGHKAVVFSQWSGMLALTEPVVKRVGLGYVTLTGDVPSAKRGALIERFFDDPDCRVFFSTDAGGVGLNLQAADLVVNLDLPWNPAVLEQRIGRAHRHGQANPVHVINLIAQGTIEERMLDTLAAKRNVFAGVFGTDEAPERLSFQDAGQGLLKRLDELLGAPAAEPVLELAPTVEAGAPPEEQAPIELVSRPAEDARRVAPTLRGFADLLVARLANRVLLVRKPPSGAEAGVLVVVDRGPADLRPAIEAVIGEYFAPDVPTLHLMEQEGYRALTALLPAAPASPEDEPYRAPALPSPAGASGREMLHRRIRKAGEGLDFAAKRLALAEVVLKGGFPEEMLRPIREALGWALSSLLALHKDHEPGGDLPSPRLVQADLVEPGRLPDELAARLSRVRELTEPPAEGETAPPPTVKVGEVLAEAVRELIEMGRQRVVAQGL
ncbi:MAG: hypothetical protein HY784_00225 [Chloroflexi bacterium]|nr:hypothetical protein [Chloroflexota bacterium]